MRASGNGNVGVCADNLLKIVRGENPYERVKGLNPRSIDRPFTEAEAEIAQEAEWCLNHYEPRAAIEGVTVDMAVNGDFVVNATIAETE